MTSPIRTCSSDSYGAVWNRFAGNRAVTLLDKDSSIATLTF